MNATELARETSFMIDTGAALNIIKIRSIHPDTPLDPCDKIYLSGITPEKIGTLGSINAQIFGYPVTLHAVPNDFPIVQEGILGSEFLRGASKLDFKRKYILWQGIEIPFAQQETVVAPARSQSTFYVRVGNANHVTSGYVPRLFAGDGIYLGDAVVTNRDGRAYLRVINTNNTDKELIVPTIELREIETISKIGPYDDKKRPVISNDTHVLTYKTVNQIQKITNKEQKNYGLDGNKNDPLSVNPSRHKRAESPECPRGNKISTHSLRGDKDNLSPNDRKTNPPPTPSPTKPDKGKLEPLNFKGRRPSDAKQSPLFNKKPSQTPDGQTHPNIFSVSSVSRAIPNERVDKIKQNLRLEHLNREEREHVENLVEKHDDLFHLPNDLLTCTNKIAHKITTTDERPISTKQYRFPPVHKDEINKQINSLLDHKIIEPSESPYNSPLWIVPKKADSKGNKRWRMVIDYRTLNEKTIGDAYPLPNITEILDQLGSAKYFSVFDLASGFHQIPMHEPDAQKTAFSTPYGHYQFTRMPFGLKNAPATFQRLMDQVLCGLQGLELFVYLDDIVLYASSLREHEIKFKKLAERLKSANLKLQPDKCEFLRKEVTYLGHIISEDGVKPDPSKIKAVKEFPQPQNAKAIKQFLGLAGYYRRFIPNFSKTAKPLTDLLKKDAPFVWEKQQSEAFDLLRNSLCSQPLLQYPDFTQPFIVTTDASGYAIGGILSQGPIGRDLPIAYTSRLLNGAEKNYSTIEKELLAIVYSVHYFRPYLYGRKFMLITDHKPLKWLHSVKDPTSRLVRWRLKLAEYEYSVEYKAGKNNVNADALSRNPVLMISPSDRQENDGDTDSSHDSPSEREDSDTESDENISSANETDDIELTEQTNSEHTAEKPEFHHVKDNILMRKDNVVIFVTQRGEPCDKGAKLLSESDETIDLADGTLGRAKVISQTNRRIIALTIKERSTRTIDFEILKESFRSLLDVIIELDLNTISICQDNVAEVGWLEIKRMLTRMFSETNIKIIICTNFIQIPNVTKREGIIAENHSSAIGGHKGITKTYYRVKQRYHWPHMKREIENFVNNCRDCQLKKLVRVKPRQPMVLTDTPDAAFEKISMDIMGPLPTTPTENTYILTIQDLLTKYSLAIPLKTASAISVAQAFISEFICVYGAPKAVLTDQGTHFINSLMRIVARKFKITQFKTTAYRPQSNGSVERSHHVLWEYLKQFTSKNDWDEYLKLAAFSYNTSVHEGTKFTPYELVFGKLARVPSSDPPIGDSTNESYAEYLTTLFNRIRDTQSYARQNLIAAKERSKHYYDQRTQPRNFRIGKEAFLLKEPRKGKLSDQYLGPYTIVEILRNNNVKIDLGNGRTRVVHMDKLKLSKGTRPISRGKLRLDKENPPPRT